MQMSESWKKADNFEKLEKKMRINLTNLRLFESLLHELETEHWIVTGKKKYKWLKLNQK